MICSWATVHEDKRVSVAGDHAEEGDISNRNCRHESTYATLNGHELSDSQAVARHRF